MDVKVFITLFLAVFVTTTGVGLVAPLLPVYAHELGAGSFQIGLIFGSFSLSRSVFVPFFGKLSDRKSKKLLLSAGLFLYFCLSLAYVASKNVETIILVRLGQGFSSAMIFPVAQAYVGLITPEHQEGKIMGIFNLSLFSGLSVGPVLGGVVRDLLNIQFSFLSMAALTLIGFFLCLFLLPSKTAEKKNIPENNKKAVPYMVLIKDSSVLYLFLFRACFTLCIGITWAFLPLLASTKLGLSSSAIGLIVMVNVFIAGLLQAPVGFLADRIGKKFLVTLGGILGIISILCMNTASSFGALALANVLLGLSGGISTPAIMALGVIEGRRSEAMGGMMGLMALAHSLGMLMGPMLAGTLIDLFSFETTFYLGATILGAGTILFLFRYRLLYA